MKLSSRALIFRTSAGLVILFLLGILFRTHLSLVTSDMQAFLLRWYDYIHSRGILAAMGHTFSNYTPPYTYLLALMTLTASFVPKVTAIKLISILSDLVNAFLVYKIVHIRYPSGLVPAWAAGAFLCLPTIFINSAFWGQADAVYTAFLLASLYFVLKEKAIWGMLAFALSFAFKAQAVFLLPFLAVLLFKKQIKPWHFVLIPLVYVVLCLPVLFLGRGWTDVLTIYLNQSETYHSLSRNAPNLYIFISHRYYQPGLWIGLIVTAIGTATWVALTVLRNRSFSRERLALLALTSVAFLPFLLPKMHERYFYPADVFSLVVAFFSPELWFVPLVYQVISGLSYTVYMLHASVINVAIGAIINVVVLGFLLWKQYRTSSRRRTSSGIGDLRPLREMDDM